MRRDWNLVRLLLLQLEGRDVDLGEFPPKFIHYHTWMLADSTLAVGAQVFALEGSTLFHLTETGHDFLSWARDETRWLEVRRYIADNDLPETLDILMRVAEKA